MLRVLADDIPLEKTATIDTIVNQAIDEFLNPDTSRCRFIAYRKSLTQRLAGLGATKAGQRFRAALDTRAALLSRPQFASWCQLADIAARLGPLSPTTVAALVQLATGDDPSVRMQAVWALVEGGALSEPVIAAAVQLATDSEDSTTRRAIADQLRHAPAIKNVIDLLMSLLIDSDNDVRREAVSALVEISCRHPESAIDIQSRLAIACTDPAFNKKDGGDSKAAWDFAYEALHAQVEVPIERSVQALRVY